MSRATTAARKPPAEKMDATDAEAFAIETLKGDIRDRMLTFFKGLNEPWAKMSERDQRHVIDNIGILSGDVVVGAVKIAGTRGFEFVVARIGKVSSDPKNGIQGGFQLPYTLKDLGKLAERQAEAVLIVAADLEEFMGERAKAEPDVVGDLKIPKNGKRTGDSVRDKQIEAAENLERMQKEDRKQEAAKAAGADPSTGELPAHDAPAVGDLAPPPLTSSSEPPAPDAAASAQAPLAEQSGTFTEHQPG